MQPGNPGRNQQPDLGVGGIVGVPGDAVALRTTVAIGVTAAIGTALLSFILIGLATGLGGCFAAPMSLLLPPCSGYVSGLLVGRRQGSGRFGVQWILANPFVYLAPCLAFVGLTYPGAAPPREAYPAALAALVHCVVTASAGTFFGLRSGSKRWKGTRGVACGACGYDLTGNVSGRCSECGTDTPVTDVQGPATQEPDLPEHLLRHGRKPTPRR